MQTNKSNTADPPTPSAAPRANEEEEKKRGRKDTIIAILVVALIFAVAGGIGISLLGKSAKKNESVRTEQQAEETKQKEGKESPENSVPESTEKSVRQVTSSPAGGKNADIGSSGRPETDEHTKEAPKADAISQTEPSLNFANESKKTSKETSEGKPKNAEAKAASSSTQTGQPELMKTGSDHKAEDNPQTQQTP